MARFFYRIIRESVISFLPNIGLLMSITGLVYELIYFPVKSVGYLPY